MDFLNRLPLIGTIRDLKKQVSTLQTQKIEKRAKAYDPSFSTWDLGQGNSGNAGYYGRFGRLSFPELEDIYFKSATVRAIIDSITRTVSSLEFKIVEKDSEGASVLDDQTKRDIDDCTEFFLNPNINYESFTTMRSKLVRDALIYDGCVMEKVKNSRGELQEIFARDPSGFEIKINQYGRIIGYIQRVQNKVATFSDTDIIYMQLYPRTSSQYGSPPIEALLNEISAQMFSSQLIAQSFDSSQIPFGMLNLGKIGVDAYNRAKEYFKEMATGSKNRFELPIIHDTDKVEFIDMSRDNQELQLATLIDKINEMIYSCFGITPTDMGRSKDINKANAQTQESISNSKLILPITKIMSEYISSEIIWRHFSPRIKMIFEKPKESDISNIIELNKMVATGTQTINEVRARMGYNPVQGGDIPYIISPNVPGGIIEVSRLKEITDKNIEMYQGQQPQLGAAPIKTNPKTEEVPPDDEDVVEEKEEPIAAKTEKSVIPDEVSYRKMEGGGMNIPPFINILEKSSKWFIPALVGAYLHKKEKVSDVTKRLMNQLHSYLRTEIEKSFKNDFYNGVELAKVKDPSLETRGLKIALSKRIEDEMEKVDTILLGSLSSRVSNAISNYENKVAKNIPKDEKSAFIGMIKLAVFKPMSKELEEFDKHNEYAIEDLGLLTALHDSQNEKFNEVSLVKNDTDNKCEKCEALVSSNPFYKIKTGWKSDDETELVLPSYFDCENHCDISVEFK